LECRILRRKILRGAAYAALLSFAFAGAAQAESFWNPDEGWLYIDDPLPQAYLPSGHLNIPHSIVGAPGPNEPNGLGGIEQLLRGIRYDVSNPESPQKITVSVVPTGFNADQDLAKVVTLVVTRNAAPGDQGRGDGLGDLPAASKQNPETHEGPGEVGYAYAYGQHLTYEDGKFIGQNFSALKYGDIGQATTQPGGYIEKSFVEAMKNSLLEADISAENLERIKKGAFEDMTVVEEIIVGPDLEEVEENGLAVGGDATIVFTGDTPPEFDENAFGSNPEDIPKILVPEEAQEEYEDELIEDHVIPPEKIEDAVKPDPNEDSRKEKEKENIKIFEAATDFNEKGAGVKVAFIDKNGVAEWKKALGAKPEYSYMVLAEPKDTGASSTVESYPLPADLKEEFTEEHYVPAGEDAAKIAIDVETIWGNAKKAGSSRKVVFPVTLTFTVKTGEKLEKEDVVFVREQLEGDKDTLPAFGDKSFDFDLIPLNGGGGYTVKLEYLLVNGGGTFDEDDPYTVRKGDKDILVFYDGEDDKRLRGDPVFLGYYKAEPSGGGSGGCDAGLFGWAALLLPAYLAALKKRG
jgi:hypothetical protein